MNTAAEINYKLEKRGRHLLEKANLRKQLLGTVRPSYFGWHYLPRNYNSYFELSTRQLFWASDPEVNGGGEDFIEFVDATEPTTKHEAVLTQYESPIESWENSPIMQVNQELILAAGDTERKEVEEENLFDIESIIFDTSPVDLVYKCRIRREKRGTFPVFCLYLQHAPKKRTFLLAGKKCMISKSGSYMISTDPENFSRKSPSYVGKLKSNLIGTKYTIYDNGQSLLTKTDALEIGAVIYEKNLFGLKGPRKFTIILPAVDGHGIRLPISHNELSPSLLESYRTNQTNRLITYQNKSPAWDPTKKCYVINFEGRVKRASVKNFKLIRDTDPEILVMQFGKVSRDSFSMDFSYPLCALQAFGIALSSFDYKLACE